MDDKLRIYAYALGVVVIGAGAVYEANQLINGARTETVRVTCPVKMTKAGLTWMVATGQSVPLGGYSQMVVSGTLITNGKQSQLILPDPRMVESGKGTAPAWEYISIDGCVAERDNNKIESDANGFDLAPLPCACSIGEDCLVENDDGKWIDAPMYETLGHGYHYKNFQGDGCIRKSCTGSYSVDQGDDTWPKECPNE